MCVCVCVRVRWKHNLTQSSSVMLFVDLFLKSVTHISSLQELKKKASMDRLAAGARAKQG